MEIKKRTKKQKSDLQKQLDNARKKSRSLLPIHTLEVELRVNQEQKKLLIDTSEQMRQLSNVLIGTFKKNYEQMIRTKRYKKTMNKYFEITEKISKINNKIDSKPKNIGFCNYNFNSYLLFCQSKCTEMWRCF